MAKPRVFVSSTYYDLKHIRSSLEDFIESLGFEPILSEKGDIAYTPDSPLDESCYREAASADIFVLIIGGRYGSEASGNEKPPSHEFFDHYDSITKKEFDAAVSRDVPVYVLIDNPVHAEYRTYLRNKTNEAIKYAFVDSINIFHLIDEILAKPRNNPFHPFERFSDIESWLREQWAGFFRELLQRQSQQKQLASLASQIELLRAENDTLQKYLEAVIRKVSPESESTELIESERERLRERERLEKIASNRLCVNLVFWGATLDEVVDAVRRATSVDNFLALIRFPCRMLGASVIPFRNRVFYEGAVEDLNVMREIMGLTRFSEEPTGASEASHRPSET